MSLRINPANKSRSICNQIIFTLYNMHFKIKLLLHVELYYIINAITFIDTVKSRYKKSRYKKSRYKKNSRYKKFFVTYQFFTVHSKSQYKNFF